MGLLVLALAGSTSVWADGVPSNLQINGGAGDPNQITGGTFNVLQVDNSATQINDVILLFSIPGLTSTTPPAWLSSLSASIGTFSAPFLAGDLATSPSCKNTSAGLDVYSCAGLSVQNNQSNNLTNLNLANGAINGITAGVYGIYEVTLVGADLNAKGSFTVTSAVPVGTFVDAFGVSQGGTNYFTPFTESGLAVPEPSSLMLLGAGLLALAALSGRRLLTA
jgi:hypothetical protein